MSNRRAAIHLVRAQLTHGGVVSIKLPGLLERHRSLLVEKASGANTESTHASALIASLANDPKSTFVVGYAGAGKSTLLRYLATTMCSLAEADDGDMRRKLPLLLSCSDWSGTSPLPTWTCHQAARTYRLSEHTVERWMSNGSVMLLFDAIDQLPEAASRAFVEQMNSWLERVATLRVVLACRDDAYRMVFSQIHHDRVAHLEPLTQEDAKEYLGQTLQQTTGNSGMTRKANGIVDALARRGELTPAAVALLEASLKQEPNEQSTISLAATEPKAATTISENSVQVPEVVGHVSRQASPPRVEWATLAVTQAATPEDAAIKLHEIVSTELLEPRSYGDDSKPVVLTADEQEVLDELRKSIAALDEYRISSLSAVPLHRCREAIDGLRSKGIIELVLTHGVTRYSVSAVVSTR
ncbi:NACHT domain-containing protein [Nakamurella endophytica]|nr:NACHT domain-containing protein [Nakamurella endophytica]